MNVRGFSQMYGTYWFIDSLAFSQLILRSNSFFMSTEIYGAYQIYSEFFIIRFRIKSLDHVEQFPAWDSMRIAF